ncbi:hypothetical protein BRYFOR_09235 [Marvinbryantia formatexigens DSM 14469]|uniref:Uncharacterized protein n=1 Tax=Marvinbryantia formatexigens DSM 14469 TaxID=478749 RepID=C6LKN9_9FIRM|nr:hypothetical protein BRYFOR_09235 [Marvinbryantia formatexigens DSM 14469]
MGIFRTVLVFIKTAVRPVGTAIAGTGRAVASGTMERSVVRAVRGTLASKHTFFIMTAF